MEIADGMMPPRRNLTKSMIIMYSLTMAEPNMTPKQKGSQMHLKGTRKSMGIWVLHANMMDTIKPDW